MQRGNDNFADEFVSYAEASAALEMPAKVLEDLTGPGPFERYPDGSITLRQAFGASLCLMFTMFATEQTASIAVAAARDACIGGSRLLGLIWHNGGKQQITAHWFDPTDPLPMQPVLMLPAERMLTLFAEQGQKAHRCENVR